MPEPKPLSVTKISIEQVMGVEEWTLAPGKKYNIVRGANATGKSSTLEGIRNVLAGGASLANLARLVDGQPQDPKVVIQLTGEGEEYHLTKTAKGISIKGRVGQTAAFKAVDEPPAQWLARRFDGTMCSPAKFLLAKPQDQLTMFLEALPCELDIEKIDEILGDLKAEVEKAEIPIEHLHALQALAAIRAAVYNARTGVNVSHREKRDTVNQMLLEIPAEIPEGLQKEIEAKRAEITKLTAEWEVAHAVKASERSALVEAAEVELKNATAAARATADAAIDVAGRIHMEAVNEARRVHEAACAEAGRIRDLAIAEAKAAAERARAEADAANAAKRAEIDAAGAAVDRAKRELIDLDRANADIARAATLRKQADKFQAEVESLAGKAERMTAVLEALDAYKETLAENIPIKGLTVEGGLKLNGVPFAEVNTASRIEVAFAVGLFRIQQLRVMFLDGFEALDHESREALLALAEKHGVQLFAAQVADSALEVEKA